MHAYYSVFTVVYSSKTFTKGISSAGFSYIGAAVDPVKHGPCTETVVTCFIAIAYHYNNNVMQDVTLVI